MSSTSKRFYTEKIYNNYASYDTWKLRLKLSDKKPDARYIQTTVTQSVDVVDEWIGNVFRHHKNRLHNLLVGLDTEWRMPRKRGEPQPVVILQLCVGRSCLVYQIAHADKIPQSLVNFLGNPCFTFVGKCIQNDIDKLLKDYGLVVKSTKDVAEWATELHDDNHYKNSGLKTLAKEFLQLDMEKDKGITLSQWDKLRLSYDQVRYASFDAYVSFQLGYYLNKLKNKNT